MNKYDLIFESLQESLDNGEITLEEAEVLNDYAYDKYVEEATRLAKEIHKLNSDDYSATIGGDRYERMRDEVSGNISKTEDDGEGYGRFGFIYTDSLGKGKEVANDIKKYGKGVITKIHTDIARDIKSKQKKVFDTEPANSAYYDAKKRVNDKRNEFHSSNLKTGKERMHEVNSQKTYNPVKALQNKKTRVDIAKKYIDNTKKIDKHANDKLKEIIKNRKK